MVGWYVRNVKNASAFVQRNGSALSGCTLKTIHYLSKLCNNPLTLISPRFWRWESVFWKPLPNVTPCCMMRQHFQNLNLPSVRWKLHGHAGNAHRKVIKKQGKLRKVIKIFTVKWVKMSKIQKRWFLSHQFSHYFLNFC